MTTSKITARQLETAARRYTLSSARPRSRAA